MAILPQCQTILLSRSLPMYSTSIGLESFHLTSIEFDLLTLQQQPVEWLFSNGLTYLKFWDCIVPATK